MKEYEVHRQFRDPTALEALGESPARDFPDRQKSDVMRVVETFEYRKQRRLQRKMRRSIPKGGV